MYFAIRKNRAGQYWYRIVGDNNEIMAVSELFTASKVPKVRSRRFQREAKVAKVVDKTGETTERKLP